MKNCSFCNIEDKSVLSNELAFAVFDKYPVAEGHMLVIPKKHIAGYFELSADEKAAIWSLVDEVKEFQQAKFSPDGYNIGINVNHAAGQTIFHVHVHVIPRFDGDVEDPTGGVRGVIEEKRVY